MYLLSAWNGTWNYIAVIIPFLFPFPLSCLCFLISECGCVEFLGSCPFMRHDIFSQLNISLVGIKYVRFLVWYNGEIFKKLFEEWVSVVAGRGCGWRDRREMLLILNNGSS